MPETYFLEYYDQFIDHMPFCSQRELILQLVVAFPVP